MMVAWVTVGVESHCHLDSAAHPLIHSGYGEKMGVGQRVGTVNLRLGSISPPQFQLPLSLFRNFKFGCQRRLTAALPMALTSNSYVSIKMLFLKLEGSPHLI